MQFNRPAGGLYATGTTGHRGSGGGGRPGLGFVPATMGTAAAPAGHGGNCHWLTQVVPLQMPLHTPAGPVDGKQIVKLPKFSAAKTATLSDDAEFWLGHLASAIYMNRWTFEQTYVWVHLSLELPASRWFMTRIDFFQQHPGGPEEGWFAFWTEFENRFIVKDVYQLRTMFESRIEKQHETTYTFGDAILHLSQQLGLDKDSRETIRQFNKRLSNRSVRKKLSTARPATLEQAVAWAIDYELDVAAEKKERSRGLQRMNREPANQWVTGKSLRPVHQHTSSFQNKLKSCTNVLLVWGKS